ncbi:MAG: DUF1761 domain-containing protein [Candidatus Woesearchaeota archaeon]|nr:MAG: DUF1761 domain-containing protein [Candidatus Woesearchaeota archaeon]
MVLTNTLRFILAVLLPAVASMILGMLWYGPLFGKAWVKLSGFTDKQIKATKKKGMGKSYFVAFVNSLVMSFVLVLFVNSFTANLVGALFLSFLIWIGFIATISLGSILWEGKSIKLYFINVLYHLVNLAVMVAVIFGVLRI